MTEETQKSLRELREDSLKTIRQVRDEQLEAARVQVEKTRAELNPMEYFVAESDFYYKQFPQQMDFKSSAHLHRHFLTTLLDRLDYMTVTVGFRQEVINIIREKLHWIQKECYKRGYIYDLL